MALQINGWDVSGKLFGCNERDTFIIADDVAGERLLRDMGYSSYNGRSGGLYPIERLPELWAASGCNGWIISAGQDRDAPGGQYALPGEPAVFRGFDIEEGLWSYLYSIAEDAALTHETRVRDLDDGTSEVVVFHAWEDSANAYVYRADTEELCEQEYTVGEKYAKNSLTAALLFEREPSQRVDLYDAPDEFVRLCRTAAGRLGGWMSENEWVARHGCAAKSDIDDFHALVNDESTLGEPVWTNYLGNGRILEVTLAEADLQYADDPILEQVVGDYFFKVELLCTDREYASSYYHGTNGVIERYATSGFDIAEIVLWAEAVDEAYPMDAALRRCGFSAADAALSAAREARKSRSHTDCGRHAIKL